MDTFRIRVICIVTIIDWFDKLSWRPSWVSTLDALNFGNIYSVCSLPRFNELNALFGTPLFIMDFCRSEKLSDLYAVNEQKCLQLLVIDGWAVTEIRGWRFWAICLEEILNECFLWIGGNAAKRWWVSVLLCVDGGERTWFLLLDNNALGKDVNKVFSELRFFLWNHCFAFVFHLRAVGDIYQV